MVAQLCRRPCILHRRSSLSALPEPYPPPPPARRCPLAPAPCPLLCNRTEQKSSITTEIPLFSNHMSFSCLRYSKALLKLILRKKYQSRWKDNFNSNHSSCKTLSFLQELKKKSNYRTLFPCKCFYATSYCSGKSWKQLLILTFFKQF